MSSTLTNRICHTAQVLALCIAGVCAVAAGVLVGRSYLEDARYREVSKLACSAASAGGETARQIDWGALRAINEHIVAWLSVTGTPIDYPVVQPTSDQPRDWYLTHDLWGAPSDAGTPYLDVRADANGSHMLVYGHRMGWSDRMFGALGDAWKPAVFEELGPATWTTPERDTLTAIPFCALRVDASYQQIQSFTLPEAHDVTALARTLARDASTRTAEWQTHARHAERLLSLVTCSDAQSGATDRTIVIFVACKAGTCDSSAYETETLT